MNSAIEAAKNDIIAIIRETASGLPNDENDAKLERILEALFEDGRSYEKDTFDARSLVLR